jgi:glycosyltransferase involved in cell wall biosynthesis
MMASNRILFARSADASNLNAQAKNLQNMLRRWRSTKYRPVMFSFSDPDEGIAANPNVDILPVSPDRFWTARIFAAYMRQFDAVFCPGLHHFSDWAALKVRSAVGRSLPVIMTMEGLLSVKGDDSYNRRFSEVAGHLAFGQETSEQRWRRRNSLYQRSRRIIAISPFLGKMAKAQYGDKVSVLPLGVDMSLFRRTHWQGQRRARIVCAAHVKPHKQPRIFLTLARRFPQADFVWYGEGELRGALVKEAAQTGVANLSFPGLQQPEALAREFAASDIMILPSRNEGVPKVTQEAAASGLAQVVFGFYETPSVVDSVNGFVVWSEDEIAAKLMSLLADRDLCERMGRAGAKMAQAWSWDRIAPQWEQKIIEVVEGRNQIPKRSNQDEKNYLMVS